MARMILTLCGSRRNCSIARVLFVGIACSLSPHLAAISSDWDREGARRAWEEATSLKEVLSEASQPSRESYLQCIRAYQRVYVKDPHFISSPEAIYEAARLYQEMGEKFGDLSDYQNAAKLYRFLTTDYDGSKHCPDALLRLGTICEGPLGDEKAAQDAYARLRLHYQSSAAAALLAAQLKGNGTKPAPVLTPALPAPPAPSPQPVLPSDGNTGALSHVKNVQFQSDKDHTEVVITLDRQARYTQSHLSDPERVYLDVAHSTLNHDLIDRTFVVNDKLLKQVRVAQNLPDVVRVVLDLNGSTGYSVSARNDSSQITLDIEERGTQLAESASPGKLPSPAPSIPVGGLNLPTVAAPKTKTEPSALAGNQAAVSLPPPVVDSRASSPPPAATKSESKPPEEKPVSAAKQGKNVQSESSAVSKDASNHSASTGAKDPVKAEVPSPPVSANVPPLPKTSLPTSKGDRTLTRTLGLKIGRIVLDPGHGGQDKGTIGPGGLVEKDLVLQVAKDLQQLLQEKLGAEVILTRNDDTFIPLEERTEFANQQRADLFVSIHANSSSSRNISGVETYYLDFARSDHAREVAARENAISDHNLRDLQDLIQKIAQADKQEESRELASIIQKNLYLGVQKMLPESQDRGVRCAPFVVLIGAHMPSVLAEVAFISNPRDEKVLKKEVSRQSLAAALFRGIEGYIETLGGGVAQSRDISK
jgi:N-acetylmuramoyl-L-alanine amidase